MLLIVRCRANKGYQAKFIEANRATFDADYNPLKDEWIRRTRFVLQYALPKTINGPPRNGEERSIEEGYQLFFQ